MRAGRRSGGDGALRAAVDATPLYGPRTGVGRFTGELLAHLAAEPGLELVAYATTWRGRGDLPGLVPAGVRTVRAPMAARPLRAAWRRMDHPRIERWTGPVDVVHGGNFVVPPAAGAQVVTVHDLTFRRYPELCTADVLAYPALLRRALDRGAWVHTVSCFVRDEVIELLGAPEDRVVCVANGVTAGAPGHAGRGGRLVGGGRYVLAVGTVEPRKNLPRLVAAFDEVAAGDPELRLAIAGPDGWGTDALEAALGTTMHRDRVVRLGFVDDRARADLLAGAAVVAVPSVYEGFGLVAAEAMAAGTPVVAAAAGGLVEVVGDAGVLVDPTDVADIVRGLHAVLDDDALVADLRRRGPEQAVRFSWDACAAGIVELWRRAVGSS
ncbi:MAG: glycosyltransferase family 1 protein [Acidimicrobiales bacterium]